MVRKIAREQAKLETKQDKNNTNDKKAVWKCTRIIIVIVFVEKEITMKNIFQNSSSNLVRYNKYEWRTSADGKCYITPAADAKPSIYYNGIVI